MATLFFAVYPTATTPTWTRGGANDGWSGSPTAYGQQTSAPAAPQTDYDPTITWTGSLSAATAYKIWSIWDDGASSSNGGAPFGSAEFTTAVEVAIGQVIETDTAQALTVVAGGVSAALTQVQSTETAQALTVATAISTALTQAAETDAAQTLAALQPGEFAAVNETDTAQALAVATTITAAIAQVQSTETAQPLTPVLVSSAGISMALEIDAAQALSAIANQSATITQVESTETAQALTVVADGGTATAAEIWSYTLSSGLTAEATLVAIHTMLSELHLIHGLTAGSPLSVTVASRAAGAVSQAVAEAAGTVTVTRQ